MPPSRIKRIEVAERRIKMLEMRRRKATWEEIANALGYNSPGAACQDLARLQEQRMKDLALPADMVRQEELEHLEMLTRKAIEIMEAEHSKWVGGEDGQSVPDYGPALQAIEALRRLSERRSKLLGTDAPTKVEADGVLKVIVESTDFDVENLK